MQGVEVVDHLLLGRPEQTWGPAPIGTASEAELAAAG
jgi:hypothetical protein